MVAALATTVVSASDQPRPMEWLSLDLPTTNDVIRAAALMRGLTRVQVEGARRRWLQEWLEMDESFPKPNDRACPLLESLIVRANGHMNDGPAAAVPDMATFPSLDGRPPSAVPQHRHR